MKYTEREQNGSSVIIWDEIEDDFNLKMTKTHNLHIKWINFLFNGSFLCRNYLMLFLTMKNSKFSSVFLNSPISENRQNFEIVEFLNENFEK